MSTVGENMLRSQAAVCAGILAETVNAVFHDGITAEAFLAERFRQDRRMGARDRKFVSNTVFAYFRWRGWLLKAGCADEGNVSGKKWCLPLLGCLAAEGNPVEQSRDWALRCGIFPDEYLKLCTAERSPAKRFTGFLKLAKLSPHIGLHIWDVLPEWVRQEVDEYKDEARFPEWLQRRPPVWIRSQADYPNILLNSLKTSGYDAVQHPSVPNALRIENVRGNLTNTLDYKNGMFEIQDFSSQCIGLATQASPGDVWWDACAGAGGKSIQLSFLMRKLGAVFATDIREDALDELRKRAVRAGITSIRSAVWDGLKPGVLSSAKFDGVLVDAPCSSSGRWRRCPDGRWSASPEKVEEYAQKQYRILSSASRGVAPGGKLVYATCSFFKRENEMNVTKFLMRHPDFKLEPFPHPITGLPTNGMLRILPWDADCDASFVARLRRNDN